MNRLVIKNGRVVDPSQNLDRAADVAITDGEIAAVAENIDAAGSEVFDASGMIVAPGFIDMHVHLREPGFEHAETIETGSQNGRGGRVYFHLLHAEYATGERQRDCDELHRGSRTAFCESKCLSDRRYHEKQRRGRIGGDRLHEASRRRGDIR